MPISTATDRDLAWPNMAERALLEKAQRERGILIAYNDFEELVFDRLAVLLRQTTEKGGWRARADYHTKLEAAINLAEAFVISHGLRPNRDRYFQYPAFLQQFLPAVSVAYIAVMLLAIVLAAPPALSVMLGMVALSFMVVTGMEFLNTHLKRQQEQLFMERLQELPNASTAVAPPLKALLIQRLTNPEPGQRYWSILEARRFFRLARNSQGDLSSLESMFDNQLQQSKRHYDFFTPLFYLFVAPMVGFIATALISSAATMLVMGIAVPLAPVVGVFMGVVGAYGLGQAIASWYDSHQDQRVVDSVVVTSQTTSGNPVVLQDNPAWQHGVGMVLNSRDTTLEYLKTYPSADRQLRT